MAFADLFKKTKNPKSPTKEGQDTTANISADVIPFLNIIAKNSIALPGMARDMNVLRQNIVQLVKLKSAEAVTTKADKFFRTEEQREKDLEDARKAEKVTLTEGEGEGRKKKMGAGSEEKDMANKIGRAHV